MKQNEFDALFEEASEDLHDDIDYHVKKSHDDLPEIDNVWELEYEGNIVGLLNNINTELEAEQTKQNIKNAEKALVIGSEAEAFDENTQEQIESDLKSIKETVETITEINEYVSKLIPLLPELKNNLDDLEQPVETHTTETTDNTDKDNTDTEDTQNKDDSTEHSENKPATSFG